MTSPLTAVGEERLRECPFCGARAMGPYSGTSLWWISCTACEATQSHGTETGVVSLWNRRSPVPEGDGLRPTHRHVKRGSEYVLIGYGKMQAEGWYVPTNGSGPAFPIDSEPADMREVAIYRSVDDGSLWVRPREEFDDGRFVALASPAPVKAEAEVVAWRWKDWWPKDEPFESKHWNYSPDPPTEDAVGCLYEPLYATPSSGGRREALEEAPLIHLRPDDGQPAWKQVNDAFERHGLAAPDWRFRDELVSWLAWAHYGKRAVGK